MWRILSFVFAVYLAIVLIDICAGRPDQAAILIELIGTVVARMLRDLGNLLIFVSGM